MKQFVTVIGLLGFCFLSLYSQCSFTATVTPNNLVMCPYDTAFLITETYDSYQWYKDGSLLSGETNQTLMVVASADAGSQFYVECTLAACTENSDTVLVDGWVFLLPYVITNTTPVEIGGSGEAYYCNETVVELELGMPYTDNIVWYQDGTPIPGEDSTILHITEGGYYHVSGAPALCPDFIQTLGVTIPIFFYPPFEADWPWMYATLYDTCHNCAECYYYNLDSLCSDTLLHTGLSMDPSAIDQACGDGWVWWGRVECYDSLGCLDIDTIEIPLEAIEENALLQLNLFPNPAFDIVQLTLQDDMENYQVRFMDMYGRIVKQQKLSSTINISDLNSGIYILEVFSKKYYLRKRMVKI